MCIYIVDFKNFNCIITYIILYSRILFYILECFTLII